MKRLYSTIKQSVIWVVVLDFLLFLISPEDSGIGAGWDRRRSRGKRFDNHRYGAVKIFFWIGVTVLFWISVPLLFKVADME